MNWDRIEDNWNRIKGNVIEQWDDLTEGELVSRIQETYGTADDEAERELTDWQQRLSEINRAARPPQARS
ncbi:MAG TPA: general stress protein CsbD [Burkholderiales bacterium]|nr:general stress protein CsbD [Burkholderiales bacterium]